MQSSHFQHVQSLCINSGNENEALNSWEKYESQGSSKSGAFQTTVTDAFESQQAEFDPSRTCAHKIFVSYSAIAGIFAGLLGLGQFLGESSYQSNIYILTKQKHKT